MYTLIIFLNLFIYFKDNNLIRYLQCPVWLKGGDVHHTPEVSVEFCKVNKLMYINSCTVSISDSKAMNP